LRTRTRVALLAAGVALGAVAVTNALPGGSPVATMLPAPAAGSATESTPEAAATTASDSARTATSQRPPRGSIAAAAGIRELRAAENTVIVSAAGSVTAATAPTGKALATGGPDAFTTRYAAAFGMTSAHSLSKTESQTMLGGDTVTRYQQTAGGLPVLGGEIVVTSHGKQVRSAIAETSGLSPARTRATISADAATDTAVGSIASELGLAASTLRAGRPQLTLYDPTLLGAPGSASLRPTWQVEITDSTGGDVAKVLVDALDGKTRLTMSEKQSARNRIVCDLANVPVDLNQPSAYECTNTSKLGMQSSTRTEGESATGIAEIDEAYDILGATYDFYKTNFKVDSFDGRGGQVRATVRACHYSCPFENAYWDGTQFVFGPGFVADDVVGHEYTHAVTEWSSHLIYAYQAGAINEALSDIMGEFVDQQYVAANEADPSIKWQLGEDLPASSDLTPPLRRMDNPNLKGQPSSVGGTYWYNGESDNGGVHRNSGPANYAAYLIAAGLPGAIGNAESEQLWWRVMHILPSAADYTTLGAALNSACVQLIGHFGITSADCDVVATAVTQTKMTAAAQSVSTTGVTRVALCDTSAAQPVDTLYFDGFEKPGTWSLSSSYYWLNLPSAEASYQYALSGVGSLNGWTPNAGGNATTATMPRTVTVPAGVDTFLHLSQATLDPSPTATMSLQISVDNGAWQLPPLATGYPVGGVLPTSKGFSDFRLALKSYGGHTVRFRFILGVSTSNANLFDWYVDNFRIYTCANRPAAPTGYAYYDATTAVVGGLSTAFIPSGQTLDHYELAYSTPLPGAPTSIPAGQGGFTLAGADGIIRTVKVRAWTATGVASDWTSLLLSSQAPVSCQSMAYPVWSPTGRPNAMCRALAPVFRPPTA
jgi:bacillolysin